MTALLRWREGAQASEDELRAVAREHIASYKLPRIFIYVAEIVRSPSGKADYCWARDTAAQRMEGS